MRIQMTGRRMELTDSLKAFAKEKIGRLAKYYDGIIKAQLILSPDFVARGSARRNEKLDPQDVDTKTDAAERQAAELAEPEGRPRTLPEVSGRVVSAELVLTVRRERAPFVARARGESCQAAIDIVVDKMERQLCKHKEKLADKRQ